jgi:hypothetical protein
MVYGFQNRKNRKQFFNFEYLILKSTDHAKTHPRPRQDPLGTKSGPARDLPRTPLGLTRDLTRTRLGPNRTCLQLNRDLPRTSQGLDLAGPTWDLIEAYSGLAHDLLGTFL